jgi:hypothetical protein
MRLEVLGQLANPFAQNCDLHLRTAGIGVMGAVLLDNVCLSCGCQHSSVTPVSSIPLEKVSTKV